ncbi:NrfD/PsrC family molybdoenzyme membrane anchor subunit, partial [Adlercreutzia sp. DFI.6.23]|uniref:NrfD/PsrC family molybdoenzyme membrane anchor subunit n=1 Tax=Adlercreutzia sp. DFI.6.23 TaxID=2963705 RepID=UPI00210AA41C
LYANVKELPAYLDTPVMSSIACTVAAIGMVVVDLGQPARLWELFAYSNLGSPLMWDIVDS